jgi:predicted  nucleic acid-binding Zn-ribbon protein
MLPVIEKLLALQDCDRQLIQLRTELAQIPPRRQLLLGKAAQSQSSFTAAKEAAMKVESERKRLELEVETKQAQIDKCLTQQAQTKKNDEYQAFTHQIATIKEAIRQIEDQQIELMEKAELAAKEVAAANVVAKELKAVADSQITDLAKAEDSLKQRIATFEADRKRLAGEVGDDSALAKYERLLKNKGPNAIVGIEHSVCGGCHMQLPTQITLDCRAMDNLVSCPNCGRLLYFSAGMTLAVSA